MAGKPRSFLNSLKNSAPVNTFTHINQTHKDKRFLIDFIIPDSVFVEPSPFVRFLISAGAGSNLAL